MIIIPIRLLVSQYATMAPEEKEVKRGLKYHCGNRRIFIIISEVPKLASNLTQFWLQQTDSSTLIRGKHSVVKFKLDPLLCLRVLVT